MFANGESCGRAGSSEASPDLHRVRDKKQISNFKTFLHVLFLMRTLISPQNNQSYLYPKYWQMKSDRWEFQVSAHTVSREETTLIWRRLEPFTCNTTERHRHTWASVLSFEHLLNTGKVQTVTLQSPVSTCEHSQSPVPDSEFKQKKNNWRRWENSQNKQKETRRWKLKSLHVICVVTDRG